MMIWSACVGGVLNYAVLNGSDAEMPDLKSVPFRKERQVSELFAAADTDAITALERISARLTNVTELAAQRYFPFWVPPPVATMYFSQASDLRPSITSQVYL
ncbi:hypothetical protein [Streptomyces sp. A30]|uniref:hypothetical protein n=1 Tax=Streptomyces sp. A30 TaxID=2789273 RepID=UPI00397F9E61